LIQIVFGLVGFHWNGGKVKGYRSEERDAYVFCAFFGLVGIIFWNFEGMQLWMRVLRLAVDDAVLISNAQDEIWKRVTEQVAKGTAEADAALDREREWYYEEREKTQKLLSEANTRCRDLETTLKVLTGHSKLPIGL
jgi:hypothetical protein